MPPASLSTFAVMNPGPTTAKNSRIRVFQLLKNLMRTFRRHRDGAVSGYQRRHRINAGSESGQTKSARSVNKSVGIFTEWGKRVPEVGRQLLKLRSQHADHVVGRDDPG